MKAKSKVKSILCNDRDTDTLYLCELLIYFIAEIGCILNCIIINDIPHVMIFIEVFLAPFPTAFTLYHSSCHRAKQENVTNVFVLYIVYIDYIYDSWVGSGVLFSTRLGPVSFTHIIC